MLIKQGKGIMKAATRIHHGYTNENGEGVDVIIEPGEEILKDFLSEIPEHLVLETLSANNPGELSRDQLMMLAKIGPYSSGGPIIEHQEMNEDDLRESLDNLRSKQDLVDWMNTVRPDFGRLNKVEQTRALMTDLIVIELTGDPDDDENLEE